MTDQHSKLTLRKLCYWLALAVLAYGLARNLWWLYDHGKLSALHLIVQPIAYAAFAWWLTMVSRGHKGAAWTWLVWSALCMPLVILNAFFMPDGLAVASIVYYALSTLPGAVLAIVVIRTKQTDSP